MVTQETYLFYDTIRANLLYARPDASDADLVAAPGRPTFMSLSCHCLTAMIQLSVNEAIG